MSYGLQTLTAGGAVTLNISDRTPRLVSITNVTVPQSGTTTVTVTSAATTTNSIATLDSGASATVTATGQVTLYGSQTNYGNTSLRMMLL